MKIIKFFVYSILFAALIVGGVLFGARFADGPLEIIAGGPFRSGELVTGPEPDWSFVRDLETVEFQLERPPRSRTTWIVEHEGRIYIPSGYMTTAWGKIWKQWPLEAERDGSSILRVGDQLYQRQLIRRKTGPEVAAVVALIAEKYNIPATPEAVASDYLWLFEMAPR
ncbi:hypothetical protein EYC98_13890 [Halieaceae bacterium IMCC14734]|uniref:Uncharacterized protein n=1 Tax=Candidatus Litorirhabdus singularis TaxID=2518993 RepID=A0ABT3TIW2_9GAMM|nr:hypothetical protein [Candidatus Litorirhabdus singularis]MCX2981949.1 hypothetical protein [Candidatus Litorirhabdus singularis]